MRALSKSPDHRQANILTFMQEVTGQADVQQAWTNATSGGAVRPQTSPLPNQGVPNQAPSFGAANPSQPYTPQGQPPFQQTSPLPSGMGQAGMGSLPTGQQPAYGQTPAPMQAPQGYNTGAGQQPSYNSGAGQAYNTGAGQYGAGQSGAGQYGGAQYGSAAMATPAPKAIHMAN
jgi:hypothetical protein